MRPGGSIGVKVSLCAEAPAAMCISRLRPLLLLVAALGLLPAAEPAGGQAGFFTNCRDPSGKKCKDWAKCGPCFRTQGKKACYEVGPLSNSFDMTMGRRFDYFRGTLETGTSYVAGRNVTLRFSLWYYNTKTKKWLALPRKTVMRHHGRHLHVVLVDAATSYISHVHPVEFQSLQPAADGQFVVRAVFPAAGRYVAALDFAVNGDAVDMCVSENGGHMHTKVQKTGGSVKACAKLQDNSARDACVKKATYRATVGMGSVRLPFVVTGSPRLKAAITTSVDPRAAKLVRTAAFGEVVDGSRAARRPWHVVESERSCNASKAGCYQVSLKVGAGARTKAKPVIDPFTKKPFPPSPPAPPTECIGGGGRWDWTGLPPSCWEAAPPAKGALTGPWKFAAPTKLASTTLLRATLAEARKCLRLTLTVRDTQGRAVLNLEPYLNSPGHVMIVKRGLGTVIHTHASLPTKIAPKNCVLDMSMKAPPKSFGPDLVVQTDKMTSEGLWTVVFSIAVKGRLLVSTFNVQVGSATCAASTMCVLPTTSPEFTRKSSVCKLTLFDAARKKGSASCPDPCAAKPCKNGGKCARNASGRPAFACRCPARWGGARCETDVHVDCAGAFGVEGKCSKTCGGGVAVSTFRVTTAAKNGGKECAVADKATNTHPCNQKRCPCFGSPCAFGGVCTDVRGKFSCACKAGRGGVNCLTAVACPANSAGSPCKCDKGTKLNGGITIAWDSTKQVYTSACVVDDPCQAGTNDCDGAAICSRTGPGTHSCACKTGTWTPASYGKGKQCIAWKVCAKGFKQTTAPSLKNDRACAQIVPCYGAYRGWGTCSKTCGAGTQTAPFIVTTAAKHGGKACPAKDKSRKSRACTVKACVVDCVGAYGAWSACSQTCGAGAQSATFKVTRAAANGGKACAAKTGATKRRACTVKACAVNCAGAYGGWSACSKSCGVGTQMTAYKVTMAAANGGTACPAAPKSRTCTVRPCPVNCVGAYAAWGACDRTCDLGSQSTQFKITKAAANGGTACVAANRATKSRTCKPLNAAQTWIECDLRVAKSVSVTATAAVPEAVLKVGPIRDAFKAAIVAEIAAETGMPACTATGKPAGCATIVVSITAARRRLMDTVRRMLRADAQAKILLLVVIAKGTPAVKARTAESIIVAAATNPAYAAVVISAAKASLVFTAAVAAQKEKAAALKAADVQAAKDQTDTILAVAVVVALLVAITGFQWSRKSVTRGKIGFGNGGSEMVRMENVDDMEDVNLA